MRAVLLILIHNSKIFFLLFILLMEKSVKLEDIDNNIMKLTFSDVDNKYTISLSGYNIEDSHRKCALQYYDKTDDSLKAISTCDADVTNSDTSIDATKCIYDCKSVKLRINGRDFNKIKYIKWCQGKNDEEVKNCPIKRVFKVKDLYLQSKLKVQKNTNDFILKIKKEIFKGLNQKVDNVASVSEPENNDFYTEKSINVNISEFESTHTIEFNDKSPEIILFSKKYIEDVFIADGSKVNVGNKNFYTLTLQNPNPSKLCYFGIKEINDLHFSSNCAIMNKSGPCIQPCYKATLTHEEDLNFAQIHINPIGEKYSKEFIQTVTFISIPPVITFPDDSPKVTVNLSDLNKNEDSKSNTSVEGAQITEMKLITKYKGIDNVGDDPQCSGSCKNFESITIENLKKLTEYILKIRIKGLTTIDSPEVNHYHRYIYFKTKGKRFHSNAIIKKTAVSDKNTEVDVTLHNIFLGRSEGQKICELYYSAVENEVAKFPATCRKGDKETFCSDTCNKSFRVVNLDPKTNYKITLCSKGYTCKESENIGTSGITISMEISHDNSAEKTTATLSSEGGNIGDSLGYSLVEKISQKLLVDCLNSVCNPSLGGTGSSRTLEIPWTTIKADITYELVLINMDQSLPIKADFIRVEPDGKEDIVLKFGGEKNKYTVKFKGDFINTNNGKTCSLKKSNEDLSEFQNAGAGDSQITKNCEEFAKEVEINVKIEKIVNYISLSYEETIKVPINVVKPEMKSGISSKSSIGKLSYTSKASIARSGHSGTPEEDDGLKASDPGLGPKGPLEQGDAQEDSPSIERSPSGDDDGTPQVAGGVPPKPSLQPPQTKEVKVTVGIVFSYSMDNYEEIDHRVKLSEDKIIFTISKCFLSCKGFKDQKEESSFTETKDNDATCTLGSYLMVFDELVEDYHIICPKYFDFHYFYENTLIKNNAPVFSRFYYNLKVDVKNKLGITLVNDSPSQICTFEWVDATAPHPTRFFSNTCKNNNNCVYSLCGSVTFADIDESVQAVKIRVLKLGMKAQISYQNNIYLLKHGNDIPVTSENNNQIKINISTNNKDESGEPIVASTSVQCELKIWNTYAPLISETGRKAVDNPSNCDFQELTITTNLVSLPNDIMVTITDIPNYNPRKYFYHKTTQSKDLSIVEGSVKPTTDGFTFTPGAQATESACTIQVKEKTSNHYFPAFCSKNELCLKKCNLQFTITGLYSGVAYDIKIIPSGDYNTKTISNKETTGNTIEFKVSPESTKSCLKIIPNGEIDSSSTTNCYYQLYKIENDSSTKILQSCVECADDSDKNKKCNNIEFDKNLYSNKNNYRLMIYANGKSAPVKIQIPKFSRHGKLEHTLKIINSDHIDKISISLKEFPGGNQCALKITKFDDLSLFQQPSCTSGNADGEFCILQCGSRDFDISYVYSKIDRYVPICYGSNNEEAKKCKNSSVYHLKMDYIQKNTYGINHANGEISLSYKTTSITNWKVSVDGINDLFSESKLNDFAVSSYSTSIENKIAKFSLDRLIEFYNFETPDMWPGIYYYVNNTFLRKNAPLRSQIIYTVTKLDNNENKLNINFSPGPYNDEICLITVFGVKEDGSDDVNTILNNFGGSNGGRYQLCQDGIISFEGQHTKVGVIVKRRFDSAGFKQYYLKGDNGFTLGGITDAGVTLSGLGHYKTINSPGSTPTCTIKISKSNLISSEFNAQIKNSDCNTQCDDSYAINGLTAGINYIISVQITNTGINSDYIKKVTFRTTGGTDLTASTSNIMKKSGTATVTPFQNNPLFPICRIFLKKNGESSKKFMATCQKTGACINKCDSEMIITNLELGVTYEATVEPSDGMKIRSFEISTISINPTISLTLNSESDLKAELTFDEKDNSSKCPFVLHEKVDENTEKIVTWCSDEEDCSVNKCVININGLSKEKDYKLRVKVKDYSKYNLYSILLNKKINMPRIINYIEEQKLRSEYTNIDVDDIIQKVIKNVEKGNIFKKKLNNKFIESEEKQEFEALSNIHSSFSRYIFYAMLPIVASLIVIIGIALYRRNSKDITYDL